VAKDPKDGFQELYEAYGREQLVQAGRDHLDGNLKLKARRHTRRFWIAFAVCVAVAVWLAVLGIVFLLERANESADRFERQRREHLDLVVPD
jgi:hypothetical protein